MPCRSRHSSQVRCSYQFVILFPDPPFQCFVDMPYNKTSPKKPSNLRIAEKSLYQFRLSWYIAIGGFRNISLSPTAKGEAERGGVVHVTQKPPRHDACLNMQANVPNSRAYKRGHRYMWVLAISSAGRS